VMRFGLASHSGEASRSSRSGGSGVRITARPAITLNQCRKSILSPHGTPQSSRVVFPIYRSPLFSRDTTISDTAWGSRMCTVLLLNIHIEQPLPGPVEPPVLPPPPTKQRQGRCNSSQNVGHSITWCPSR
jgi:hypothetical protein